MNARVPLLACCLVGSAIALAWRFHGELRESLAGEPSFPALPPLPSTCSVAPAQRDAWVERQASQVDGLARRYALEPRAGVRVSAMLAELAACGPAGSDGALAQRASELRARVDRDYRAHRVALWAALERDDWPAVKGQVAWLGGLVAEPPSDVSAWLRGLEQRAEAKEK